MKIARRSKFKDCTKPGVRRIFTDYQVTLRAEISRQTNLKKWIAAEAAFEDFLISKRVKFVREKIVLNGDRFVLVDFFLTDHNLAIEVDGSSHDDQKGYDEGRDKWLLARGIKTYRIKNAEAKDSLKCAKKLIEWGIATIG